jgi:TonB family protein
MHRPFLFRSFNQLVLFCTLLLTAPLVHGQDLASVAQGSSSAAMQPVAFSQPIFPGGPTALSAFLKDNLHYPAEASELHVSGRVLVTFWVDETGHTYGFGAVQSPHEVLTQEALRVAKRMPNWEPGRQEGKLAPMMVYLPITFRLMDQP